MNILGKGCHTKWEWQSYLEQTHDNVRNFQLYDGDDNGKFVGMAVSICLIDND